MSGLSTIIILILVVLFLITSMFLPPTQPCLDSDNHIKKKYNPEINKVADGLYITDFINAKDYDTLKDLGVRQILTVGAELPRHGEPMFKVMTVNVLDLPAVNIKKHFNSTYNFIKRGPTVVHCAAGISRSSTIVAAFLMRMYNLSADKAIAHLVACRSVVNPNSGFRDQLKQFETELAAKAGAADGAETETEAE